MPTTTGHAWAAGEFLFECKAWGRTSNWTFLPEGVGVKADTYNGSVPDVLGFASEQKLESEATYQNHPFLIAEVLSKRTAKNDRTRKKEQYARIGVQLYVLIDPRNHSVEVFRLQDGAYGAPEKLSENEIWQPAELPGLKVELARLWM